MLETIWFLLWGILWAVYFMLDGFDLGLGTLAPFIARNDNEKESYTIPWVLFGTPMKSG